MIWALLALIGVPIWLILTALGGALWSRRSFRRQPGVFKVATRDAGAESWKRTSTGYARCISNVFVINIGLALMRTRMHEVRHVEAVDVNASPRGFDNPQARQLLLDDDSTIEVAAEAAQIEKIDSLVRSELQ